jgi:hypothetical protein
MITDIYYTYASKKELLDIGADPATIFENISELELISDDEDNCFETLNQVELTPEQALKLIPEGEYCYSVKTHEDGSVERKTCPFWNKIVDFPKQNNGYCHFRKQGDWQGSGIGMLWDQCKCCGINETREENLILE